VRRLGYALAAALIVVAMGVLSSVATQGFQELGQARGERARLEARRAELEARIAELEATLEAVTSDPEAVESLARVELGWVKPGETVIILATPTPVPPAAADGPVPTPILRLPD
jgi:cell division protein FtsB